MFPAVVTTEESPMLARCEAELTLEGFHFINIELIKDRLFLILSSTLFNILTYHLFRSLPRECELWFGDSTTKAIAFSDVMNLIAKTPHGLQALIPD